jgi:hypothetical protein
MTMSAEESGSKNSPTTATSNNNNNNNNNNNSKHHTHHSRMLHTIKTENAEHFSPQQHIDSGKWHNGPNGLPPLSAQPPPPLHPPSSLHNGRWDDGPPVYSALVKVCILSLKLKTESFKIRDRLYMMTQFIITHFIWSFYRQF